MDHTSGVPDLSFRLLDEITDGFSPDRILGTGSFGTVYEGVHRNGKKIAVKVLHDRITLDDKQFINEYNNLTKLQHHNIVRLVGYCQENKKQCVNYEGRLVIGEQIKRILCFEYLHNGGLNKYLSDEHHGQDWNTRYIIIKGICNGLKYLHEDLEAPMYHLDLKPANILLDENMEPRIADFGLSRLFGEETTRTTTSTIGTLGYLPPEYIEKNIISNKLDIFSLGVIVIKIMTGRSGYYKCFEMPPQQFIQLVQNNWRNRLQKPTDFEEVKRCIKIALRCLEVDRRSRPTIGEIVHELSETETRIHNLSTQPPHWLRNDSVALDNSKNVPVSCDKQQGNDSGPSMQQAPPVLAIVNESKKCIPFGVPLLELGRGGLTSPSKLTASSRLGPGLEGAAASGSGSLSKVELEMLVLLGEFSNDNQEIRTGEEFKRHTVQGPDVNETRHPPKLADEVSHLEGISKGEAEFLWGLRKYVLLLATLAASVTYSAGLSPPGGFWHDNVDGGVLLAGDPVLQVTYPRRYNAFFYCNATAFVASLVIVNLLLVRSLCHHRRWLRALQATMMLDQFSLMGAYAAGSCRDEAMSTYVFVLVALVASYVSAQVLVFSLLAPSAHGGDMDTPDGSVESARKYLLIFATLAATITYQAGLNTPGGFWPGNQANDHLAGDLLLSTHHPFRFMVFFYSNSTTFVASLVIVMLLMSNTVTRHGFRSCALWVCTATAMVGLMVAFASGSSWSIYVVALVAAVLFYIALQALVFCCEPGKNVIHDAQVALERYLKFERLEQQLQQHQQSRASEHGDCDAHQILRKSRMYLLLLGVLAASVTYQAGLNPPGGFWQDNAADGHHHYLAGDPILYITYPWRYLAFFYCNATAFIASLVILVLLLSNIFSTQGIKYCALQIAMILDLFGLIGAYAVGSCRQVSKSVYVSLLFIPVFLYVGIHVAVFMLEVFPAWAAWRQALREKMEQCAPGWLKEVFEHAEEEEEVAAERTLEKRRKILLLLAILAASVTYQAGMSPPGGFWQESKPGSHVAGDPVLNDNYRRRYLAFFYCNATAFVASLAIIMLLVNRKLSTRRIRCYALRVCVILDLVGLLGAFAAGSCRTVSTSIYVLVLTFAVLLYIALQVALVLSDTVRGLANSFMSKIGGAIQDDARDSGLPATAAGTPLARDLWGEKLPKYLLLLAALAAAVTYQAAMSPPGGLWGDGLTEHVAGDPILASIYPRRYKAFFYCNTTSFMASLVVMVLLLIKRVSNTPPALLALHAAMILDLFGLMGAYAAGSCRRVRTSAYILALVIGVSAYIAVLVVVSSGVARWLRSAMDKLAEKVARCFSLHDL